MAEIQYEDDAQYGQSSYATSQTQQPLFIRLVLSTGLVSSEEQAQHVLLGIALGATLLALFFFIHSGKSAPRPLSPAELEQLQQMSQASKQQ